MSSGTLFGGTAAAGGASGGGLFSASKPAGGGLFGTTAPATGGGLFANPAPATGATGTGGGLFSNQPATSGGGLFGGAGGTSTTAGGGLFGGSTTAGGTSTGGLFGGTSSTPAAGGGGLFGGGSTTGGLFGGGTTTGATGGLFGGSTTTGATGGLFGGAAAGAQQTQPGNPQAHKDFYSGPMDIIQPKAAIGVLNAPTPVQNMFPGFLQFPQATSAIGRPLVSTIPKASVTTRKSTVVSSEEQRISEEDRQEVEKFRPLYTNRDAIFDGKTASIYSKPVSALPAQDQQNITTLNKTITQTTTRIADMKKNSQELSALIKEKLSPEISSCYMKFKTINIKIKKFRQEIGILNDYGNFLIWVCGDFSKYYEGLRVERSLVLQIPSESLNSIVSFINNSVKQLQEMLNDLIIAAQPSSEAESLSITEEFGAIFEQLYQYMVNVMQKVAQCRQYLAFLKRQIGLGTTDRPTVSSVFGAAAGASDSMNEEVFEPLTRNLDELTKLFN